MSKAGLILSSVTLLLSVVVHISTFIPPLAATMALAMPLHFCAMASFAFMIFTALPLLRSRPRPVGEGIFACWKRSSLESRDLQRRAIQSVPRPARIIVALAFAYTLINFVLFGVLIEGGVPAKENGAYYLHSHGKKIRDLTEQEYHQMQAYVAREFSGHWILFSLIPVFFFTYVRPRLVAERAERLPTPSALSAHAPVREINTR